MTMMAAVLIVMLYVQSLCGFRILQGSRKSRGLWEMQSQQEGGEGVGQKRQTFFFRLFLFQRERRSNSSMDIPKTLKNSS